MLRRWHRLRDETATVAAFQRLPRPIIVPGWTGSYWVKHVTSIQAVSKPERGFWMNPAYRLPLGKFPLVSRLTTQDTATNTPITELVVNSLITSHEDGARIKAGSTGNVGGIAWDGGYAIRTVEVSIDGGKSWAPAALGQAPGRFPFRLFSFVFKLKAKGKNTVMARKQHHWPGPHPGTDSKSGWLSP